MDLTQWLAYIETLHPRTIELGLESVRALGERANILNPDMKVVLVAGTNGKGTTLFALEKLLTAGSQKVACYTSPHLCRFNERITIKGQEVSDSMLLEAFEAIEHFRQKSPLTYFEFTTLAAFYLFKKFENNIDVLLCEVGLGGRLDAVNVLSPDLSVITTIDYDHQAWLGNDLESIAYEKAGILREQKPCVLGEGVTQNSVAQQVKTLNSTCYSTNREFGWQHEQSDSWFFGKNQVKVPQNDLPKNSVSCALAAYNILRKKICLPELSKIIGCLTNIAMQGRYQCIAKQPNVILDVAHNKQSCEHLKMKLLQSKVQGRRWAIFSMLNDKPIVEVAQLFKNLFAGWILVGLDVPRATSIQQLKQAFEINAIDNVVAFERLSQAMRYALQMTDKKDEIIVFGSFHLVGDAITHFEEAHQQCAMN